MHIKMKVMKTMTRVRFTVCCMSRRASEWPWKMKCWWYAYGVDHPKAEQTNRKCGLIILRTLAPPLMHFSFNRRKNKTWARKILCGPLTDSQNNHGPRNKGTVPLCWPAPKMWSPAGALNQSSAQREEKIHIRIFLFLLFFSAQEAKSWFWTSPVPKDFH